MTHNIDLLSLAVTHSLARSENGGSWPTEEKTGKTGETKSIFQFTPETWKKDSQEILGNQNTPLTPENESVVVLGKVKKWLGKGYSPPQIASMWNAGEGEPNAYTGKFSDGSSSVGVNKKYGVKFDVPSYAKRVDEYTKETYKKLLSSGSSTDGVQNGENNASPNQSNQEL